MNWGDFKKSYAAGGDAYREAKSRWVVPIVVVIALTIEMSRRHAISWIFVAVVLAVALALFLIVERYIRRHNGRT